jgi:hypothetical protein
MNFVSQFVRLVPLAAGVLLAATSLAAAQADPEKPVTPPDSYRVVMENDRMRMIEIHIKARSKVSVDSPAGRDRFLYMLSDGALILAPPGKTPYEFALHAGETAVFPAVSPTVENDTDSAVRALMVEIKTPTRSAASGGGRGKFAKGKSRVRVAAKSAGNKSAGNKSGGNKSAGNRSGARSSASRSQSKSKVAKSRGPQASTTSVANAPLNLRNANARPTKKVTGKRRGSDG